MKTFSRAKVIIDPETDIKKYLHKSMTTKSDIEKLMKLLGVKGNVAWQMDFDPNEPAQVLNIGNGLIGGTHWVAVDNANKRYFDSFGLPPVSSIPPDYEWAPLRIQNHDYGHCGQYAVLFLYYSQKDELDKFYNLFEALP